MNEIKWFTTFRLLIKFKKKNATFLLQFRVLIGNLIGFGWVIFLTMKRRKLQNQLDTAKNTRIIVTDESSGTGARKRKSKESN